MAWTHINDGTVVPAQDANLAVVWPTHSTGDIGILVVSLQHSGIASTPTPSGWTLVDNHDDGDDELISVFGKIALSSSEANVVVVIADNGSNDVHIAAISVFAGGSLTISATPVHTQHAGNTNIPYGSYTPADNNTLVLIAVGHGNGDVDSITDPSGFTQGFFAQTQLSWDAAVTLKWQIQTTAAAITGANMIGETSGPSVTTIFALEAAAAGSALPFMMHLS